jgi:hypothetical protein
VGGRLLASGIGRVARQWLGKQGMSDGRGLCGIYPMDEACFGTIRLFSLGELVRNQRRAMPVKSGDVDAGRSNAGDVCVCV